MTSPKSKYVAIEIEGHRAVHATSASGQYATLCGLADDGETEQHFVQLSSTDRISCAACLQICRHAKKYRPSDFKIGLWERNA